jgi:hypothetical protein
MTVYMVFEPPRRDEDRLVHAERIAFVRDRFSWAAFLFAPLWLLWHRLWLALVIYVAAIAALMAGLWVVGAGVEARGWTVVLVNLLLGFEAATVRRWTLLRRGWRERGTVIGDDREAAERRFFDAYVAETSSGASSGSIAAPPPGSPRPGATDVIGLFPQPGAGR